MMLFKRFLALFVCIGLSIMSATSFAAINSMNLGANYDSARTNVTFRVYSSQATRVVLYLYGNG